MRHALVLTTMGLTLACCAVPAEIPVRASRTALLGQTPAQVQACMGSPATTQTRGGTTLYTYTSAHAQIVTPTDLTSVNFDYAPLSGDPPMPGLGGAAGPISVAGCLVNVIFESGKVHWVTYVGSGGRLVRQAPECTEVLQRCVH